MQREQQGPDDWRARATELADELRGIIEALSVRQVTADELAAATELARSLRRRLDGPARARWYQASAEASSLDDASRIAFLDQSPVRGRLNPVAPPLVAEVVEHADGHRTLEGRVRMGMAYEGPPHGVHGGWMAALFDDLLGAAQGLGPAAGLTTSLTVRYRDITPIGEDLRLRGWIREDEGRRIVAQGTCHAGETLTAEAEARFTRVDFKRMQERMWGRRGGGAG